MSPYRSRAYTGLDARSQTLYNFLVRYHQKHNGRRASHREMVDATGLCQEILMRHLSVLETAGLYEVERDNQRRARSYRLPGEKWHHPHVTKLETDKAFYTGSLIDPA